MSQSKIHSLVILDIKLKHITLKDFDRMKIFAPILYSIDKLVKICASSTENARIIQLIPTSASNFHKV